MILKAIKWKRIINMSNFCGAGHEVNRGNIGKHTFYGNRQSHIGFKGLTADIINVALIYNICSISVLNRDQAFRRAKYAYCDLLSWSCSRDGLSVLRVRVSCGNMTASWPHRKMIPDTWLPSYLRLSSWRLPCGPPRSHSSSASVSLTLRVLPLLFPAVNEISTIYCAYYLN